MLSVYSMVHHLMMVYNPHYLFALLFTKATLSLCPSELLEQNSAGSVRLP